MMMMEKHFDAYGRPYFRVAVRAPSDPKHEFLAQAEKRLRELDGKPSLRARLAVIRLGRAVRAEILER